MKSARRFVAYAVVWGLIGAVVIALGIGTYEVDALKAGTAGPQRLNVISQSYLIYASEPAESSTAVIGTNSTTPMTILPLGVSFAHFVVLADRSLVYATAFGGDGTNGTLFVLSLPNFNEVATVPVGFGAQHLAITQDESLVFVSAADGTLSEVNTTNSALMRKIYLGGAPQDVAISSEHGIVLVANSGLDAVQEVDTASGRLVNSLTGLGKPVKISISSDQSFAVVTSEGSMTMTVLRIPDLKVRASVTFGSVPHQLYLDSGRGYAYVGLQNGSIALVNLKSDRVMKMLRVGGEPMDMQPSPSGNMLYVAGGNELDIVNLNDQSTIRALDLGTVVHGIAIVPGSGTGLATSQQSTTKSLPSGGNVSNFTCGG